VIITDVGAVIIVNLELYHGRYLPFAIVANGVVDSTYPLLSAPVLLMRYDHPYYYYCYYCYYCY